jgi:hypothetical protein
MDEGSKQLLAHTRQPIEMEAGEPERVDYEEERKGVCRVFVAMEPETGACHVQARKRRTGKDWALFMREVMEVHYPQAEKIVLVMENLKTPSPASFPEVFEPAEARRLTEKLEIHDTPKHGSWWTIAEMELSLFARQCLDERFPSMQALATQVEAWQQERNQAGVTINWRFPAENARIRLKRLYPSIGE